MPGDAERVARAEQILHAAREAGVPVVFFQEVHRRSGIDFGRELDGTESVHCLDGDVATELVDSLRPREGEFHIVKRRYSGFIGTEFEIVLRGTRAPSTLILIGGLTDVCVHYTFADAHQRDFYVRVVSDCVGGSSHRTAHRITRCHGVPANRCRTHHQRDHRRLRRAHDNASIPIPGGGIAMKRTMRTKKPRNRRQRRSRRRNGAWPPVDPHPVAAVAAAAARARPRDRPTTSCICRSWRTRASRRTRTSTTPARASS